MPLALCHVPRLPLTLPPLPSRKQAVSTQTQELQALEARLRAAEERLQQAKGNSPPRRKDSQRRTPVEAVFPDKLQTGNTAPTTDPTGALPVTPSSP